MISICQATESMYRLRSFILSLIFMMAWASCSRHANDYSMFVDIPSKGWEYARTLVFRPAIEDAVAEGTLSLAVRHTNGYPYRNLYLEVSYPDRDSNSTLMRDTVNVELADIYGNWHGSGLGTSFQFSMTLNDNFLLSDSSEIRVRHIMRPDPVTDIEQVGIVFVATK